MIKRIILFTLIALLLIAMLVVEKTSTNKWSELKVEKWTTLASSGFWACQVDSTNKVRIVELDPELD